MNTMLQDVRYSIRMLTKAPLVALTVIVTLGLGIGANSVIFSAVNALLIRPLPYPSADRLTVVQGAPIWSDADPNRILEWKDRVHSFKSISAFSINTTGVNLVDSQGPVRVAACAVTSEFFDTLQVNPELGRFFQPDDMNAGSNHVAVLSHRFWTSRYNANRDLIGRPIMVNGMQFNVIGVAQAGVDLPQETEMWIPVSLSDDNIGPTIAMSVISRLRDGVSMDAADAELKSLQAELERTVPGSRFIGPISITNLRDWKAGRTRTALLITFGAVAFVLLIACINVVSILLARSTGRQKEVAIRVALGAGRRRLVGQFLTESVILSLTGGTLGLLLTGWGIAALQQIGLPRAMQGVVIELDVRVFAFCVALSLLCGIGAGLLPAIKASTAGPMAILKEAGDSARSSQRIAYRVLAGFEIAMALILLTGAGLLIRSFARVSAEALGFEARNILTVAFQLPRTAYPTAEDRETFFNEAFHKIRALPGVKSVSAATSVPLASRMLQGSPFTINGAPEQKTNQPEFVVMTAVTPGYLQTMGIKFLKGRDVRSSDSSGSELVAIVDEGLVKQYFKRRDPIGSQIMLLVDGKPRTIIGVVRSTKSWREEKVIPVVYLAASQTGASLEYIAIKYEGDTKGLVNGVKAQIFSIDSELPLYDMKTMDQRLSDSLSDRRFTLTLLSIFAVIAMILAAIGVFGVFSYTVSEKTREIGIRIALGARTDQVTRMVLRQGLITTICGVAAGLIGAVALTRLMSGLLYSVSATDPLTLVAAALLLSSLSMAGCYLPARKSAKLDPLVALRHE